MTNEIDSEQVRKTLERVAPEVVKPRGRDIRDRIAASPVASLIIFGAIILAVGGAFFLVIGGVYCLLTGTPLF